MSIKIAINGLGRIGRCIIRAAVESGRDDIEIVAANGTASIEDHAHLLKYDSIHGVFKHDIKIQGDQLIIGKHQIKIIAERDPAKIDWTALNVNYVMECTGKFTSRDQASIHLSSGASKVIVSAPCDQADSTIVLGVNQQDLKASHQVISVGSCTTNALAPVAKVLNDSFGIETGFMTTIHSYTNDQNILDGSHRDRRRARACAISMIPASTGAAKAIGLVLPQLAGKLAGSAVRVPTPNVSMIDLCFNAKTDLTVSAINEAMQAAAHGAMKNILAISPDKLVSVDFNHNPHSSIFDPFETTVVGSRLGRVVSWYDNEWGFSIRMLDAAILFASL